MGSLIAAITANTIMIFAMKYAEDGGGNRNNVILWNYIFGSAVALFLTGGVDRNLVIPVCLGFLNAFLMVLCMLTQQTSIGANGAGISTTYNRLGVLIPTILSIFLFKEYPTILKLMGITLSIAAILYSYEKSGNGPKKNYLLLWTILITGGLIDFDSKLLGTFAGDEMKGVYTFYTFFFSACIMGVITFIKKSKMTRRDIGYGAIIGVPNILITFGVVSAAAKLPAYIVFPVYSGAVILLVNGISAFFLKERLTKREVISTGMIAIALVLLNI